MSQQESFRYLPVDLLLRWTNLQARIARTGHNPERSDALAQDVLTSLGEAWKQGYDDGAARMAIEKAADAEVAKIRRAAIEAGAPKSVVVGEKLRVVDDAEGGLVRWGVVTSSNDLPQPYIALDEPAEIAAPIHDLQRRQLSPHCLALGESRLFEGTLVTLKSGADDRIYRDILQYSARRGWFLDGHVVSAATDSFVKNADESWTPHVAMVGAQVYTAGDVLTLYLPNKGEFVGPLTFNQDGARWEVDGFPIMHPDVSSIKVRGRQQ
jgi:hypothetical protein